MRRFVLLCGLVIVSWIGWSVATAYPPVSAYHKWADRLRVSLGLWPACSEHAAADIDVQCFGPSPPQRFKGVWLDLLDRSGCFLPGRSKLPAELSDGECLELDDPGGRLPTVNELEAEDYPLDRRVALIEIVGRRTRFPTAMPGVGGSLVFGDEIRRHVIVVDQALSFRVLEEIARESR